LLLYQFRRRLRRSLRAYDHYIGAMRGVPTEAAGDLFQRPGVAVHLILCCFLGLRQEKSALVLDPAIRRA